MKPLRVAFLGASGLARSHIEAFYNLPSVHIAAVADIHEPVLTAIQNEFKIPNIYKDYREMLRREQLDAAVIVLPTFLHKQATFDCLDAGLHVLCEKPPANNSDEMRMIAGKVGEVGTTYMFCRQSRFHPLVTASRRLIAEGKLGTICGSQAHWIRSRSKQLSDKSWRMDRNQGGGVLLDLGIHGLDTIWFCLGCPKVVEISAAEFSAFKDFSQSPETYSADDGAVGWIRFDNGSVLQYKFAYGMNVAGPLSIGKDQKPGRLETWQSYKIYGTHGGVDIFANEFISGPVDKLVINPICEGDFNTGLYRAQAAEFVRAIDTGTEPLNSLDHALQLMDMLGALHESSELRRAVSFDNRRVNAPIKV